jgi:hypothetical protein
MFCKDLNQIKQVFRLAYTQAELMLKSGKQIDVEVTEHKNKRSIEQNNYYWFINGLIEKCLYDAGIEIEYEIKILKIVWKRPVNQKDIHEINKDTFGIETTTKLSVKEFCEYMNKVFILWIENTQGALEIPELPDSYLQRKGYMELVK